MQLLLLVIVSLLTALALLFIILIVETRALTRQQKIFDKLMQQREPSITEDKLTRLHDNITRQRGQYISYLQARLGKHGIPFEQELEWVENEEERYFEQMIAR